METLTFPTENFNFRLFKFDSQNQYQVRSQRKAKKPQIMRSAEEQNLQVGGEHEAASTPANLRISENEIKGDKVIKRTETEIKACDNKPNSEENPTDDKPKKKKKWRKLSLSELGFHISLFPRPVRNNRDIEKDAEELFAKIEKECDLIEEITNPYEDLIELEGNTQGRAKNIRADRDKRVMKAHKQIKTKHCRCVLNNKGRKTLYVKHRVYKMMSLDINRLCYMPSPKRDKNLEKRLVAKGKDKCSVNSSTDNSHQPNRAFRPTPVQCLAHAIHKDNLPSDLDAALANLLMNLQHRELTPEDYDLLLRLDEARVEPKTVSENKLSAFKTETVESNDQLEVCPICMELYEKGQVRKYLPCSHAFHSNCIDAWLKNSSMNCPIDNLPIDS